MKALDKLINEREGESLAFVQSADDSFRIAETLVAFANTKGGILLIGLKASGKITGIDPDSELQKITEISRTNCKPQISFSTQIHREGFRIVLQVNVPENENKPFKALNEQHQWVAFVRNETQSVPVNKILEKVWKYKEINGLKPEVLSADEERIVDLIKSNPGLSLTRLYKNSDLPMKSTDYILVRLLSWEIIQMNLSRSGNTFLPV